MVSPGRRQGREPICVLPRRRPGGTAATTAAPPRVDFDLLLGQSEGGFCLHGAMYDVRLWNTALAGDRIRARMNRDLAGDETDLVGHWIHDAKPGRDGGPGAAGPHAHALQFNGERYAILPQSTKFTGGDFTVSLWFDPVKTGSSQFLFMRGFDYRDQQGDIALKINRDSGNLDFQARTSDGRWLFGWDVPESRLRGAFKLKEWNHVVLTRRGDTYTMWMNGVKVGSEHSTADISDTDNTNPFIVGGTMTDSGVRDLFQGALDDFRIFHRCLSDAEIAALYNGGDAGGKRLPGKAAVAIPTPTRVPDRRSNPMVVDEVPTIEVHFSPEGVREAVIVREIKRAEKSIRIQAYELASGFNHETRWSRSTSAYQR